jgi:hypothetical protein
MKFLKIQAVIMALVLVTIPFLGINEAQAFTKWINVRGTNISLERQEVVAKSDKVLLEAKFFNAMDADSYKWNWDICGTKSTSTTSTWYTKKNFTFKNVGNCVVKVDGQAVYNAEIINGQPTDAVIIPGYVSNTVNVLPVQNVAVVISGPSTAKVGQTFWLESAYTGATNFNLITWNWSSKGVCKGTSGAYGSLTTKIGETGDSVGTCTKTLNLRVEFPDKVIKGTAVKNIAIN